MQTLASQPLIASSPLFRDIDPHEFLTMAARFQTVSYPQNTNIIERGVWHGYLYIIASGSVTVLLWQAGLASITLPGIFPPVMIGKHALVDAGMHDPVPVGVLRSMGADILVASDLSVKRLRTYKNARSFEQENEIDAARQKMRTPHIVDVLLRSFDMTMATIGMHSLRQADVAICPQVHSVSLHRFSEGHKFVTAGYDAACQAFPALRERLPWLAE